MTGMWGTTKSRPSIFPTKSSSSSNSLCVVITLQRWPLRFDGFLCFELLFSYRAHQNSGILKSHLMPKTTQTFLAPISLSKRKWEGAPFWKKFPSVQNPEGLAQSLSGASFCGPHCGSSDGAPKQSGSRGAQRSTRPASQKCYFSSETYLSLRKSKYRAKSWGRLKTGSMENILIDFYNCIWQGLCAGLSNVSIQGFSFPLLVQYS